MRLTFIGSGIERETTALDGIEIEAIARVVRERFDTLVFGGSRVGLMGDFATAFAARGGRVVAVVPDWLESAGLAWDGGERLACGSLAERKRLMFDASDAVLCYPGGVGTLDELFDLLAQRAVAGGPAAPPVYLYNWEKYFAPLLLQIEIARETGLVHAGAVRRFHPFESADGLAALLSESELVGG